MLFGIIKHSLLGLAHIVLFALSLGWGVAHAQQAGELVYVGEPFEVLEGNIVEVQVERIRGSDGDVDVSIGTDSSSSNNSAIRDTDFERLGSSQLNWENGETGIKSVRFRAIPDLLTEGEEQFGVFDLEGFRNNGPGSSTVTILDSSSPVNAGVVDFVDSTYTLNETDGSINLRLRRSAGKDGGVSVMVDLIAVTATYPDDGTFSSGSDIQTVSWGDDDDTDKTVSFFVEQDTEFPEGQERFDVALVSPTGALTIGTSNPAASIFIDDSAPPFNPGVLSFVGDYTISESMRTVRIEMTRSGGADGIVTAFLGTGGFSGDTAEPGNDYTDIRVTGDELTWGDGDLAPKFLDIQVLMDTLVEPDEIFTVTLLDTAGGAEFGNNTSAITITDTPTRPGVIAFDPDFYTIDEAGDQLTLTVTRTMGSDGVVSADFNFFGGTSPGEATEGDDFGLSNPANRTLTWEDRDSDPRSITFDIIDDTLFEGIESFTAQLSNLTGGAMFDGSSDSASVDIIDDDTAPSPGTLSFISDYTVSESMLSVSLEVTRKGGSSGEVSAFYVLGESGDSADLNIDYGVTAEPDGELVWVDGDRVSKFIDIDITLDSSAESDEQFVVSLLGTSGMAGLDDAFSAVTITDTPPVNDVVSFVDATDSVAEDGDLLSIELQRSGSGVGGVEVFYELVSGTATLGADFEDGSGCSVCSGGSVFWPSDDLSNRTIDVGIFEDLEIEGDETFTIELSIGSSSGNVSLGVPDATTITINDVPAPMPGVLQFDPDVYTVSEMGGSVELLVTRTAGSEGPASITYTVGSDTATVGVDHAVIEPVTGLLEWPADDATPRSFTVDIAADLLIEPFETFPVDLSAATGATLGAASSASVNVMDSNLPDIVVLADDAVAISEGVGTLGIVVQRVGVGTDAVSVNYSISDGTAVSPDDYAANGTVSGTVNWAIGDTADKIIDIDIVPDLILESDETFLLSLVADPVSNPVTLGSPSQTLITIIDVAPPTPGIVQFDPDVYTVAESDGLVELIVTRTGGSDGPASASFEVITGTAELGADLAITEPATGTLDWLTGDGTSRTITIDVADDSLVEGGEEFTVLLSAITGSDAGSATTAMVTLMDSTVPTPDTVVFADDSIEVDEDAGVVLLIVQRVGTGTDAVSVSYSITEGTALVGTDYGSSESLTGTVIWAVGDTAEKSIAIDVLTDNLVEANETFQVILGPDASSAPVLIGTPDTNTVTIFDTTIPPAQDVIALVESSQTRLESEPMFELVITRTGNGIGNSSVDWALSPVSASLSDDIDLGAFTGTVSWADGQIGSRIVEIPIVNDSLDETDETLTLSLVNVQGASLGAPASSQLTIIDDDDEPVVPGTVQFASGAASVDETDDALIVTVTRADGTDGAIGVNYSTTANSATAGDDFDNATGTLTWADGDGALKTFSIAIATDTLTEAAEQFSVTLDTATPAGLAAIGTPNTLIVTINNVEPLLEPEPEPAPMPGTVQFVSSATSINESAGTVSVTIERSGGTDGAVSVRYETVADSAIEGDDYQPASGRLQWADGEDDVKILSIAVNVDDNLEEDESFRVVLSDGQPADTIVGATSSVEITIVDDSIAPLGVLAFVNATLNVAESDEVVELQVSRTGGSAGAVSVGYTTVVRSADSSDFGPSSGRLNWADGDSGIRTIRVPVNRDGLVEAIEQFQVVLAEARPLGDENQLGVSLATVLISDSTRLGTLGFLATELSVTESDPSITLSVTRSDGSDGDVSVDFALIEGSAELDSDLVDQTGTLTWPDGDVEPRSITVLINPDNLVEGNEQFAVALSNAQPLGGLQLGEALTTITIIDATLTDDITAPPIAALGALDLVVVSGDGQSGLPGDLLEPLVIDVVDLGATDAALDGVPIRWRAVPEGSAELLDSGRSVSDESGRSSNRIRILSRGFLNVVATIDVAATTANGIISRINQPEFPVGQGEAVFMVRSGLFAADGLRVNQAAVGASLDAACEVLGLRIEQQETMTLEEQDLFATCQELEARLVNDDGLAAALDRLVPEELFSIGDSVIDTTDIQVTNVYSRINAIRSGQVEVLDVSGLQYRHYDQSIPGSVINAAQNGLSGGAAAADGALGSSRLAFFANGSISYGEVDGGENQSDADVETTGLTLGFDYRATDSSVYGVGLGIIRNNTDFNPDAGNAEVSGLNLTIFGTHYQNQSGYVDAVLDVGRNSYDIERRINLPNTPDQFGIGDTKADVLSFTVGAGRDFTNGAWEFGPYGRFSYIDADVDGYNERATGSTEGFGSVLNVGAHSVRSTRLAIGGQVARYISTNRGIFIPQLRAEAEFEQEDKKEGIQATFQHDPTQTPFTVNGENRDTSYVNVGIGSSALFRNGRSGFLFYETQLGNDRVTQHFLKLGLRLEF